MRSNIGRFPYAVLTAPQQVAAAIKRQILEGGLKPGDKLPPELELADLFGVSRPTIRVGLQVLCSARILEVRRGRTGGYRVGDFSLDTLETNITEFISLSLILETLKPEHFFEVRTAHELLCAETAARRRTPEMARRLEEIGWQIEHVDLEPSHAFELDVEFHRTLAEATGNSLIQSFEGAMIAVLHGLLGGGGTVAPAESIGNVREVIDAVRDGDPDRAREAMRAHLAHMLIFYGLTRENLGTDADDRITHAASAPRA